MDLTVKQAREDVWSLLQEHLWKGRLVRMTCVLIVNTPGMEIQNLGEVMDVVIGMSPDQDVTYTIRAEVFEPVNGVRP